MCVRSVVGEVIANVEVWKASVGGRTFPSCTWLGIRGSRASAISRSPFSAFPRTHDKFQSWVRRWRVESAQKMSGSGIRLSMKLYKRYRTDTSLLMGILRNWLVNVCIFSSITSMLMIWMGSDLYTRAAQCSRQVGVCLKHLPSPSTDPSKKSATYHSDNVPWQRVINARGAISPR